MDNQLSLEQFIAYVTDFYDTYKDYSEAMLAKMCRCTARYIRDMQEIKQQLEANRPNVEQQRDDYTMYCIAYDILVPETDSDPEAESGHLIDPDVGAIITPDPEPDDTSVVHPVN